MDGKQNTDLKNQGLLQSNQNTTIAAVREQASDTSDKIQEEQREIENLEKNLKIAQSKEQQRQSSSKTEETVQQINQSSGASNQNQVNLQDNDLKQLVSDLERDLLFQIIMNMRHKLISMGEAERLAKDFLALFPFETKEDLLEKMKNLGKKYPEAREVYLKYALPSQQQIDKELLDNVSQHLKNGDIDKALEIAKGGTA